MSIFTTALELILCEIPEKIQSLRPAACRAFLAEKLSLIGGLIRALVGITKSSTFTPEQFKFQWKYFASFSLLVSAIVGVMSGIITDGDWRLSLLSGYAGPIS